MYVCQTCERDGPLAPGEPSRGRALSDAVEAALREAGLEPDIALRRVNCLNGCLNPCNVALRATGKFNLRFSRLEAPHAAAVVQIAAEYHASADGDVPEDRWPAPLRGRLTVRTPPPRTHRNG